MIYRYVAIVVLLLSSNLSFAGDDWESKLLQKLNLREDTRGNQPRIHVVDPYLVERVEKKDTFYNRCRTQKFASFYEQEQCIKKASNDYFHAYPERGTDEYGEKFYGSLSKQEAKAKRDELLKLLDWASYYPKSGNEGKELTVPDIKLEITYIERYVMEITPRMYDTR
tara:strand:+ start:47 stop:550 length:504 start_codon:yes stop_codon:yes gene_type:complete